MRSEKETKTRLLESARKEFMEKGYMQSSLRTICKNAGVTTGALYFFFQDKEELFASLVEEPLRGLYQEVERHYRTEQAGNAGDWRRDLSYPEDFQEDDATSLAIIHHLYQNADAFRLLLTKSQGSRFEHCVEQMVELSERQYRFLADQMTQARGLPRVDDYMVHWQSHMLTDTFIHLFLHEPSEEAAVRHMKPIMRFLISGWLGMF